MTGGDSGSGGPSVWETSNTGTSTKARTEVVSSPVDSSRSRRTDGAQIRSERSPRRTWRPSSLQWRKLATVVAPGRWARIRRVLLSE